MYAHEVAEKDFMRRMQERQPYRAYPPMPADAHADDIIRVYLTERKLDWKLATSGQAPAGWYVSTSAGDSWVRIVIPCVNTNGFRFWQARAVEEGVKPKYQSPHGVAREDSLVVVWPRQSLVRPGLAVIVEGPMDALAAAGAGTGVAGVALMGTHPSHEAFDHIKRLFKTVLVIPDSDEAGLEAGITWQYELNTRGVTALLKFLPDGYKDLAECPQAMRRRLTGEIA